MRHSTFLALALLLWAGPAQSFPGNLDFDFGLGGVASTDLGNALGTGPETESARDLAIYPESSAFAGKILMTGNIGGFDGRVVVARYNPDGSLDSSYGENGVALVDLPDVTFANALAIQPDDKIVVVGELGVPMAGNDCFFLRFCPDGSLDDGVNCGAGGFGSGGQVSLDTPGNNTDEGLSDVLIQPDGKIVAAGSTSGPSSFDFLAVRLCANGQVDDGVNCGAGGFGSDGVAFLDVTGESDEGFGVALQPDGKILVGGRGDGFGVGDIGLVRVCADGSFDDGVNCGAGGFGSGGIVTTDLGTDTDTLNQVAVQEDGKILGAGFAFDSGSGFASSDFVVIRYCANGDLDEGSNCGAPGFVDGDGFIKEDRSDAGEQDQATGLQVQSDGKILVAGGFEDGFGAEFFFLNRYLEDGSPDPGFGFDGTVQQLVDFGRGAEEIGIQSDGKIVLGGFGAVSGGNTNFVLIRYLGDSADLSIQVTVLPSSARPGDPLVFTLSAANLSSVPAPQVKVSFSLPAGATLVSAPGCTGDAALICELGSLGANAAAAPLAVTLSSANEGVIALTAAISGGITDPVSNNDQATAFVVISAAPTGGDDGDGDGDGDG
ncbi:MAG TPA: hypothetical protein VFW62_02615, partial [bacterium]|nr:hypothetical protein [bacterium]